MIKEATAATLLLTLSLLCALQQRGGEAAAREKSKVKSAMSPSREPVRATQPNPAPAPFGKYTENINGVALELVRVPTGSFLMGNDRSPNPEEKPAHQVSLKSFYLGQYEVTTQQWNIVAETLPKVKYNLYRKHIGPLLRWVVEETTPADAMWWDEAVEFCERLTRFTGRKYRLPSEAEWEYACRAGTTTEFSFGDEVNFNLAHFRNIAANDPSYWLLPVGKKGYANAWGFYDMHGNVGEWCLDAEHRNYNGAPTDGSAWGRGGGCQRGGFYASRSEFGRSSSRLFWSGGPGISQFGFRVVAEINPTMGSSRISATSAASYSSSGLATETIGVLFGANLSAVTQSAPGLPLPTTLAGASVFLKDSQGNEYLAPLFFTSANQINFQIPSGLAFGAATIYAVNNGNIHSTGSVEVTNVSPGLFSADASGAGLAAAVTLRIKANGEQVYESVGRFDPESNRFVAVPIDVSNPAEQVFLLLFGTGFRHRSDLSNVKATVGGADAEVMFASAQGDLIGLDQANLRLSPSLAGRGQVEVSLTADGKTTNTVLVNIGNSQQ